MSNAHAVVGCAVTAFAKLIVGNAVGSLRIPIERTPSLKNLNSAPDVNFGRQPHATKRNAKS
jgi:hypothetical protein